VVAIIPLHLFLTPWVRDEKRAARVPSSIFQGCEPWLGLVSSYAFHGFSMLGLLQRR
jgi:hypothetical protein